MTRADLETAWAAVPDRALVAASRTTHPATFIGYRYGARGRWVRFYDEWEFGEVCWDWRPSDYLIDFVVIAKDVSPHTTGAELGALCQMQWPENLQAQRTMIRFNRGARILWDDILPGMLVMVEHKHVVYRLPSGNGVWVRHACERWWSVTGNDGWRWRSYDVHGAGNGGVCAVLAMDVAPNDEAIRAAIRLDQAGPLGRRCQCMRWCSSYATTACTCGGDTASKARCSQRGMAGDGRGLSDTMTRD